MQAVSASDTPLAQRFGDSRSNLLDRLAIFRKTCYTLKSRGHVAQWIEHQVPVLRVGGSNPSVLTEINKKIDRSRSIFLWPMLKDLWLFGRVHNTAVRTLQQNADS
jgi:hypothetical protein